MSRRPGAFRATLASLGFVAAVVVGCAPLPAETTPRAIDRDKVEDLFPEASSTTSAATGGEDGVVCFVPQEEETDVSKLACIPIKVPAREARYLIDALATGPNDAQRNAGLASLVPPGTRLLGAERSGSTGGHLTIDLSTEINDVSSPNNIRAYQQIFETLSDEKNGLGVRTLAVRVDGERAKIPTDDGPKLIATADDFHEPGSTTTTSPKRESSSR